MAISKLAFFGQPGTYEATLFEETFGSGLGSFTAVNDSNNEWVVGTTANTTIGSGGNSAYISDDSGTSWDYTSTSEVSHIYTDITFPTSGEDFVLKFLWAGEGEDGSGASSYDYMRVSLAPTTETPSDGTEISSAYRLDYGSSAQNYGKYNEGHPTYPTSSATYVQESIPMTQFSEGTGLAGQTKRLIFTWKNDGSIEGATPISLDSIQITYTAKAGTDSEPNLGTLQNRLPSANLVMLLDPSAETLDSLGNPITADATAVAQIQDQSIEGNDAEQTTASNRPSWYSTGQGSRPYIDFDGTNDSLDISDSAQLRNSEMTIYFVISPQRSQFVGFANNDDTPGVYDTYFMKGGSISWNDGYGAWMDSSNNLRTFADNYSTNNITNSEHDTDPLGAKILCYRFDTSTANNCLLNDGTEETGTNPTTIGSGGDDLEIGSGAGGSFYATFKMYTLVIYDTYHDDATRASVMSALNDYFGGIY